MFPELLGCGASEIQGIDVSEKMTDLARRRFGNDPRVSVSREDFLHHLVPGYDVIMAFNVYDHFPDAEAFLFHAHMLLTRGGRLTVAFSHDRKQVNLLNEELPAGITREIFSAEKEALRWNNFFQVDCVCDNEWIYLISGLSR